MTYFLETSKLRFRNWLDSDIGLAKMLWGNEVVTQTCFDEEPLTDDQIRVMLHSEITTLQQFGVQYWPLFSLKNDEFIGVCGLHPYKRFDGIFEFNTQILPEHCNKGFGYQASAAMIEYTIKTLNIKSFFAVHHPQNMAFANLLKNLGFSFTHLEFDSSTGINQQSYILNI